MTNEDALLLKKLKLNISSLQDYCEALKQENRQLKLELEEQQNKVIDLQYEKKELELQYENLKTGRVLSLSDEDMEVTKSNLNRMLREIDKCIELLNV